MQGGILLAAILVFSVSGALPCAGGERFDGQFFCGRGDVEYLQLLEIAQRMMEPDPEFQNIAMLYNAGWNGFVEGPTWGTWWIQNSYGPHLLRSPFWQEPYVTFVQNSQDLWFKLMGDGNRKVCEIRLPPTAAFATAPLRAASSTSRGRARRYSRLAHGVHGGRPGHAIGTPADRP